MVVQKRRLVVQSSLPNIKMQHFKYFLTVFIVAIFMVMNVTGAAIDTPPSVAEGLPESNVNRSLLRINENCHQPKETGRCFALFHRYAFNVESFACEEFIYGGCAGNRNNFETKEECEKLCFLKLEEASTGDKAIDELHSTQAIDTLDLAITTESATTLDISGSTKASEASSITL